MTSTPAPRDGRTTATDTVDVKALVLALTDAMNRHDPDEAAAFYATDAEMVKHGTGEHLVGRAAIREDIAGLMGAFADLHIRKTNFFVQGPTFADEFVMSGTHTGDLPGLPRTGRRFELPWAGFGEVREGKIVRHRLYWDLASQIAQLGVVPGPVADVAHAG